VVKTATRRDQCSGLNWSGVSTTWKRSGRDGSIDGIKRDTCSREAPVEGASSESAGTKMPSSRKRFTLLMRKSAEAEGERRIIGSGRREEEEGFFWLATRVVDGADVSGRDDVVVVLGLEVVLRPRYAIARRRTAEKSVGFVP